MTLQELCNLAKQVIPSEYLLEAEGNTAGSWFPAKVLDVRDEGLILLWVDLIYPDGSRHRRLRTLAELRPRKEPKP